MLAYTAETTSTGSSRPRVQLVLAIGPEGGWVYEELESLVAQGFQLAHMGGRIMRTDIAVRMST